MEKNYRMEKEYISILVPIHNMERYLRECLDSIVNQTYTNIEVIMLDDNSNDNSSEICMEYANKYSNFKYYKNTLKNKGVGAIRNMCIEKATSDYVIFVDADDKINENHVEILYNKLAENNADICIGNYYRFNENNSTFYFHVTDSHYYEKLYTREEVIEIIHEITEMKYYCFASPWGQIIKKELFNYVKFPEGRLAEDSITMYKLYLLSKKIVYVNAPLYCYRVREDSLSQNSWNDIQLSLDLIETIEEKIAIFATLNYDLTNHVEHYKYLLNFVSHNARVSGLENTEGYRRIKEKLDLLKKLEVIE